MGLLEDTRFIERQRFFDGQRLFADDLQGIEAFNREMRWLHNRSLHQPGIGNGFAVRGSKGDRKITVEPGYAVDDLGREIVLMHSVELDVPPVGGEKNGDPVYYDVVVSYPDDTSMEVVETRGGVCAPRGAVRLREQPVFCWVRLRRTEAGGEAPLMDPENDSLVRKSLVATDGRLAAEVASSRRIVIARAEVLNCQLNRDLSIAERRNARPSLGPRIVCDEYTPDPWDPYWWVEIEDELEVVLDNALNSGQNIADELQNALAAVLLGGRSLATVTFGPIILPLGLEATVPTGRACFRSAPHYMVRLAGERILTLDLIDILKRLGLVDPSTISIDRDPFRLVFYCEGLVNVLDPQPDQFTARLAVMVQLLDLTDATSGRTNLVEVQDQIADNYSNTEFAQRLDSCAGLSSNDRRDCIAEVAALVLETVEDEFLATLEPLGWSLVWMGVEG
jgi:hypothetical protein